MRALVLGKFMPFHYGHKHLIDFARNYPGVTRVVVVVGSMPHEPIDGEDRFRAVCDHYLGYMEVNVKHLHKVMPQEPSESETFWHQWQTELHKLAGTRIDLVFASEPYGQKLAEVLGAKFVSVDIDRSIYPISGTKIRADMSLKEWRMIVPEMRSKLSKTVTFFGQESVGKTTLSRRVAQYFGATWTPEYARPYLERVGPEVTIKKMLEIAHGQYAQDKSVKETSFKPLTIRDTDLVQTYAWWKIFFPDVFLQYRDRLVDMIKETKADLYLIPMDNIPFEPDPLRYGDGKRQMTLDQIREIAAELGLNHLFVGGYRPDHRHRFATTYIRRIL